MTPMTDAREILPVSVCIPVRNEEANLPDCLAALTDFDEIVVVDSGSTDRTLEIAKTAGASIVQFQWNGMFPKKRNWALANYRFRHPWILFLDADERMTPEFVAELRSILKNTSHSGFWISYTNWFMGKPLHHGDVFRKLALFQIGKGEYERIPENSWSALDMEVHEHPVIDGSIGILHSRLEHQDYRGLKNYLQRHNEYSSWEANRFLWFESASQKDWEPLTDRQRFKYRFLDRPWFAWFYWFVSVILKRGFCDGLSGLTLGKMKRHYFEEVRLKILESRRTRLRA
jgi:glycosyltransferase involved in cell wall biosynthesis